MPTCDPWDSFAGFHDALDFWNLGDDALGGLLVGIRGEEDKALCGEERGGVHDKSWVDDWGGDGAEGFGAGDDPFFGEDLIAGGEDIVEKPAPALAWRCWCISRGRGAAFVEEGDRASVTGGEDLRKGGEY